MNSLKFKTNIKCAGCIAASTPHLNEAVGEGNWKVDVQNPDKILTVTPDEKIDAGVVIKALEKAGYKAEPTS